MADSKCYTILRVFDNYYSAKSDFERFCRINGRMGDYSSPNLKFTYTHFPLVLVWKYIHDENQHTFTGIDVQGIFIDESVDCKYYPILNSRVRNVSDKTSIW